MRGAGCPQFKTDSVWRRPDNDPATPMTVCPGQHAMTASEGPFQIVWWDPHALDLGVEAGMGLRRESLIMKDVPDAVVEEGTRDYNTWRTNFGATSGTGSASAAVPEPNILPGSSIAIVLLALARLRWYNQRWPITGSIGNQQVVSRG